MDKKKQRKFTQELYRNVNKLDFIPTHIKNM